MSEPCFVIAERAPLEAPHRSTFTEVRGGDRFLMENKKWGRLDQAVRFHYYGDALKHFHLLGPPWSGVGSSSTAHPVGVLHDRFIDWNAGYGWEGTDGTVLPGFLDPYTAP